MPFSLILLALFVECSLIGVWLYQHVEIGRIRREGLWVDVTKPADALPALPTLTIIVPARNEEQRLEGCLQSLLTQDHPNLRIIIVDDRSEDKTSLIVERFAATDSRVSLVRIDDLPSGWLGKSHALWSAVRSADSDWLLFVDADCRLLPGGVAAAHAYAMERNLDLLSLWPRDGSEGFWERLLIPLAGAQIAIWYGSRRVQDPKSSEAFANGQFILVRRAAYLEAGGHEAVRTAIIEDIPLARRIKASGFRTLSALGTDVYAVRMYTCLGEIIEGWRRIYLGVLTRKQLACSILSIMAGSLLPYGIVIAAIVSVARDSTAWGWLWLSVGLCHLAALMTTSVRFFGLARCRLRYLWLYPLSCAGVLWILGSAIALSFGRHSVSWRDTTYDVRASSIEG